MLTIHGREFGCCDGVSRRGFVTAGTLGIGALALPDLLARRARAAESGNPLPKTSVIFVELAGGPTHFETYDPKPDAPQEYRGPLGVAATNQPGIYLSELMVEQARIFDKLAVIRSIHHDSSSHGTSSHLTQTGYYLRNRQNRDNDMPCIGSVTSRLRGANHQGVPAYVALQRTMRFGNAAYLGKGYNPFNVTSDPNRDNFKVSNLGLSKNLNADRLDDRRSLLRKIDRERALADTKGVSTSIDKFTRDAFDLVTGGAAQKAFDINAEAQEIRDCYGRNRTGQEFLLARRLIEAGVTFVTVRVGSWDDHSKIADRMKSKGPSYDRALAALVTDLHERGLDRDVMVVAMGEFGRTPKVNKSAGRDHWGQVMSVLLACGGLRTGQIVGSSNSKGEVPADKPYRPENVLATLYRHLGIDTNTTFPDLSGRPRYLLEKPELVQELV